MSLIDGREGYGLVIKSTEGLSVCTEYLFSQKYEKFNINF